MNDDEVILPNDELPEEDVLQEELAAGEGMVVTPDDLPHARLVLMRQGVETEEVFEIRGDAVIGRFDEVVGPVDIDLAPIDEGRYISRRHAEIRHDDGTWLLKDLGSSNGTFIKGEDDFEQINGEIEMFDGQIVSFGNIRFVFHVAPPAIEAGPVVSEPA